jgi:transposase
MAGVSKLLDESVVEYAQKNLKTIAGKNALLMQKLQAVISAKKHGIKKTAEFYEISRTTLTSWIKHLRNKALEKLKAPSERRRKTRLNDQHRIQIKQWIEENSQLTINQVHERIKQEFEINLSRATVHREMKRLGLAYITPRPKHFKQQKSQVDEFKKK